MARPGPKRRLLSRKLLNSLHEDGFIGVPNSVLVRNYKLELTPPTLRQLLQEYRSFLEMQKSIQKDSRKCAISILIKKLEKSLFPDWLDDESSQVQTQPDNYTYDGIFPFGNWEKVNVNTERFYKIEMAHSTLERSIKEID